MIKSFLSDFAYVWRYNPILAAADTAAILLLLFWLVGVPLLELR